jgi:hypothetical protein
MYSKFEGLPWELQRAIISELDDDDDVIYGKTFVNWSSTNPYFRKLLSPWIFSRANLGETKRSTLLVKAIAGNSEAAAYVKTLDFYPPCRGAVQKQRERTRPSIVRTKPCPQR